jgi:hypothetical protein
MGGLCKPSQTTTKQSSSTSALPEYTAAYKNILGQAQNVAQTAYDPNTEKNVAGFTAPQFQAFQGVQNNQGSYQPYLGAAGAYTAQGAGPAAAGIDQYINPFQKNVVDAAMADWQEQSARTQQQVNSNAASIGALTGDRSQVASQLAREAGDRALSSNIANLYQSGYNTALGAAQNDQNRYLQAGQQFAGLGGLAQQYGYQDVNALLGVGGMQQAQTQAELDAATGNAQQRAQFPYQNLQWLSGISTGLGGAAGQKQTGSTTTPGPSILQQVAGAGLAAASFFKDGGRVGYADGGMAGPYGERRGYVPEAAMSGQALSAAQAPAAAPSPGMANMLQDYQHAAKGLGKLSDWMRTSKDPESGWSTTVKPEGLSGWGNYLGGMLGFQHGGRVGYDDGGAVEDETSPFDYYTPYDAPAPSMPTGVVPRPRPALAAPTPVTPSAGEWETSVTPMASEGLSKLGATNASETSEGSGLFGLSDDARQALRAAGFGIMASQSPNALSALGEGGLQGLGVYQSLQDRRKKEALQKAKDAEGKMFEMNGRLVRALPDGTVQEVYKAPEKQLSELERRKVEAEISKLERDARGDNELGGDKSPAGRATLARSLGIEEGSDAFNAYVMTGKLPREDQQRLTVTDKKAILEADEAVNSTEGAIVSLQRAKELSKTAYDGATANERAWVTSQFGSQAGEDTRELLQTVTEGALQQLKAIFGGMPTEGERKVLLEVQGSAELPQAVREKIYDRAIGLANKRLAFNKARAEELRGGTYYKPNSTQPSTSPTGGTAAELSDEEILKKLGGS